MMEHMLESKRLTDYKFPYAIFISKLIDYFEVDTSDERNETIKSVNEIDCSTLSKMGFQKKENVWVYRQNVVPRVEHEASNHGDQDEGNEALPNVEYDIMEAAEASCYEMHNSSPPGMHQGTPTQSMHEEFAANDMNALIAYQEFAYRGEPLSSFEKQVLYQQIKEHNLR